MQKISILFFLLSFSFLSLADITVDDLSTIENNLSSIKNSSTSIEMDVDYIVKRFDPLVGYVYQILNQNEAAENTRLRIESILSGMKNNLEILKTDVHTILPSLDSNLQSAVSTLQICQGYLYDIKNATSNIYDELSILGTISDDLVSIKILLIEKFDHIETSLNLISTNLEEIKTTIQNIYNELLSQGLDIKDIENAIKSIFYTTSDSKLTFNVPYFDNFRGFTNINAPFFSNSGTRNTYSSYGSNYIARISQDLRQLTEYITYDTHYLANSLFRLYDIQTNFYASITIQKDIFTNVAYIASVITNSHDLLKLIASNVVKIAHHTMPTNVADQYETQQQEQIEQISSSYQDHENDMSAYESSLTHIPAKLQKPLDDGSDYIDRLNNSSVFDVNTLDDEIYVALPDYHSSLANMSFSLPIDVRLTPDIKQIFAIIRKCVTTTIWIFTFLFSLFMTQKFMQFVLWIMGLINPITRDMFGNTSSGSLYRLMGG